MSFGDATVSGLRKWLAEERTKGSELLAGGRCSDFSEYRYSVGYIKALDDTAAVIEQIQADLMKG